MRNRITVLFLMLVTLLAPALVGAQTRVLVGAAGGDSFDNYSFGVQAGIEVPFAKHYELDLRDTFSPIEEHVSLGTGRANIATVGGHIWLTDSFGINGQVEDSSYNVTLVTKDADYASGGLSYRAVVGGMPARFNFNFIRQFNNGITPSGLESSHLQGGDFGFTMRFGCLGAVCVRNSEDFVFGRVLTQGNPQCDGSFGTVITCQRGSAVGGGGAASVVLEFPRQRGHEYDRF